MESNNFVSGKKSQKKQIKSFAKIGNIKSNYILKKVFNNLKKKRILEIVKNNKNIKKRINLNINDYKEYSEKYSLIEIEIKPVNNKSGKFINIKEQDEKYYHIYFNNEKEEIKRNYLEEDEKIKIIKIIIDYKIESKSFENLFKDCQKFYMGNVTDMRYMFYGCLSLKKLNFNNSNTNNVTNMESMFNQCLALKELNLTSFNTNKVTNMGYMFYGCSSLKKLNLNNFNTNNVTNMRGMFRECSSLNQLNLNNFNTDNVTDMGGMFNGCSSLKELNVNHFNTNRVTNMGGMFSKCSSLKELNVRRYVQ